MKNQNETNTINIQTSFNKLMNNWWKITLFAILFGLLGLGFSYLQAPKYEAEAIFSSTINYSEINFENLVNEKNEPLQFTQYDLDLALGAIQRSLLKTQNAAYQFARNLDPSLSLNQFEKNTLIERLHDKWYLRYRHEDPFIAREVVNNWVDLGLDQLANDQTDGLVEPYIIVDLLLEANLPEVPVYQNRNVMILAGVVIGFIIGVIVIDFKSNISSHTKSSKNNVNKN